MTTIADLIIKISADTAKAESQVAGFGGKVAKGFKKAVVPATLALGALGAAGMVAFHNLQDGARNAKQTEAVITSTGGAANVTAKHVDDLAMSLRRKAGVDDDVIHSGENMLLTFTNVRNEVGKGNNVFDQATKVMLDMSTALGQDTKSSAIQLGKALNDPIKGVTALQRVGVSFTAAQKKQIKTLVESGHAMDAQKLILRELNKEFGGASTHIDPMQKSIANLKLDFVDFLSSLVSGLLPALQTFIGILGAGTAFLQQHQTAAKVLGLVVAGLAVAVLAVNAAMAVFNALVPVAKAATKAWAAAQWLLNAAMDANPIALVVIALAALVAAIVIAWTHCETFRNIVTTAWNAIKSVTMTVFNFVRDHIRTIMAAVLIIMTGGLAAIVLLVISKWDTIKAVTTAAWNAIKTTITTIMGSLASTISAAIAIIVGVVRTGMSSVLSAFQTAWLAIKGAVQSVCSAIENAVRTTFNTIVSLIQAAAKALRGAASAVEGALRPIINVLHEIAGAASSAAGAIQHLLDIAGKVGSLPGKIGGALNPMNHFATGVRNFSGGLAVVGEHGPELVNLPKGSSVFSNSESNRMAGGGGRQITVNVNGAQAAPLDEGRLLDLLRRAELLSA